jgi:hypothetical protein
MVGRQPYTPIRDIVSEEMHAEDRRQTGTREKIRTQNHREICRTHLPRGSELHAALGNSPKSLRVWQEIGRRQHAHQSRAGWRRVVVGQGRVGQAGERPARRRNHATVCTTEAMRPKRLCEPCDTGEGYAQARARHARHVHLAGRTRTKKRATDFMFRPMSRL